MATKEQDQQLNVQPQSIEAEQAVLGSMLASKEAISKALQWVRSHHFYNEDTGLLQDIADEAMIVKEIPSLPKNTVQTSIGVVIRVKNQS